MAYENYPTGFGMFFGHLSCRTSADGAPEEDDVSTSHFALRGEVGKRGPGVLINSFLVGSSVTTRPVSAIVDQQKIGPDAAERNEFSSDRLFQNVSVAVKYQ